MVRVLRAQGQEDVPGALADRVRDLPVPEHRARRHRVVPRPCPGSHPPQRLRRASRLLPPPRRSPGPGPGLADRTPGSASGPGTPRRRSEPSDDAIPRDTGRDPGPGLQRGRFALLSRQSGPLRRHHRRLRPGRALPADLEPRILRQHDRRQRPDLALPPRGAAALPSAPAERLPVPFPRPRLRPGPGRPGVADRQRRRLPALAGGPRRHCAPAAAGSGRARRRHRRLRGRPRRASRPAQPRARQRPCWAGSTGGAGCRPGAGRTR